MNARDAEKQSAKLTFEQFSERYTATYNDTSRTWEDREVERVDLAAHYPTFVAKWWLLDTPGLSEGSTVFVLIRKHSRTGMSRSISLFTFHARTDAGYNATPEKPQLQPLTLTYNVGKLMGYTVHNCEGSDVIRTDDYPQEFVANLSQALFGIGKHGALRCEVL